LRESFNRGGIGALTDWFNKLWTTPADFRLVLNHILLVTGFDTDAFKPVIWTLVHEMRISFIFPLIMIVVLRYNWKISLLLGLILSSLVSLLYMVIGMGKFEFNPILSIHYIFMFIIGAVLAKQKDELVKFYGLLPWYGKYGAFALAILFYTYPYWFFRNVGIFHVRTLDEWVSSLAAAIFIWIALSSLKVTALLKNKVILR
jgi:peptidoglycan/LPS O-acetylase OafA/YrhL